MRHIHPFLLLFSIFILNACRNGDGAKLDPPEQSAVGNIREPMVERDLAQIKADGVLHAIAIYNSTSYFLYRGEPMGFEYELLQRLAEELDLELKITIAENIDELFDMLNRGDGDIIAFGLTITEDRKKVVDFTEHHYVTHQALVQRKPQNWRRLPLHKIQKQLISDPLDLIGDTVHVRMGSSYYERIKNLTQEIGGPIYVDTIPGDKTTDEIIQMVVDGEIDYTVADYNIAAINQTYYPILDIETQISFSQRIAWAVRNNSPELLKVINDWIIKAKRKDYYYVIYNKYFKNKKSYKRRIKSDFFSKNTGKISHYDEMIRQNAERLNWDWRLLSSLIYQESRFDPQATSWAGAGGLMQIMPATARDLGLEALADPAANMRAGTSYLKKLWKNWEDIPDTVQRMKFVMGSYNCGLGHVRDAQRLAEAFDEDPLMWDNNVEDYVLKLSSREFFTHPVVRYGFMRGREPYLYVKEIFLRYEHYQKFIPKQPPKALKAEK
ncbi:MAG: transporter substrate-binding domain-containing protein [Owenweeksia sp.]|nr:transporter substrate-binding domain-containing protein [Owenweeksia sp.]